jgi:hypothetical protein
MLLSDHGNFRTVTKRVDQMRILRQRNEQQLTIGNGADDLDRQPAIELQLDRDACARGQ